MTTTHAESGPSRGSRTPEPERDIVRRLAPYGVPAAALALLAGSLVDGWATGWSAAVGVLVVGANFVVHGVSLAWAAHRSLTLLYAVGLGGFVVRLAAVVAAMAGLNSFAWFSPLAFGLAVVPSTMLLLGLEMKMLASRPAVDVPAPSAAAPKEKERVTP